MGWFEAAKLTTVSDSGFFPAKVGIHAVPNGWRFLERPDEHVTTTHPYTNKDFAGNSFNQNKIRKPMNEQLLKMLL